MPRTSTAIGLLHRPLPTGLPAPPHDAVAPVPLAGVVVEADVVEWCARVTVAQRYVNREAVPIEAVYVFPLDEGAAVCGFEAVVDGATVVAEVKPREEAFAAYDDALAAGHSAFLLDEERPDVFQVSVGNVPPGGEVLLRLTYETELMPEGDAIRLVVPTTVSPRYAPASDRTAVGRPDAEVLNPPAAWSVPYGLTFTARLAMPGAITRVESPSHPLATTLAGSRATVTLGQGEAPLDRDIVVVVGADGLDRPHAWLEQQAEGGAVAALAFRPRLPEARQPAEVVFLVDRSGSMGGTSIEEVRRTLQLCLRSLTAGCAFDIVGFGSRWTSLFSGSRPYDEASLQAASEHVRGLDADLGGTEILPALQAVLERPALPGLARQVVLLTDGEVTNTDAVIALASAHRATARLFTFGIGTGASAHLVRGVARAGGGAAEFIAPGERLEPKVLRQFARLLGPALTDVRLDWGGLDVQMAPASVPPVFGDGRLLVYGLLRKAPAAAAVVRLTATLRGAPIAFDVALDPGTATDGKTIGTLAARARIRELEEAGGWTPARGSAQRDRKANANVQAIVDLAMRYGLASRETSLVAVYRRETPIAGQAELRRVPIALTHGWGGAESALLGWDMFAAERPASFGAPATVVRSRASRRAWGEHQALGSAVPSVEAASLEAAHGGFVSRLADVFRPRRGKTADLDSGARAQRNDPQSTAYDRLVCDQRADGTWALPSLAAEVLGRDVDDVRAAMPVFAGHLADAECAWATALAVAWLERHAADREEEWRLLADKTLAWLDTCPAQPVSGTWLDAARAWVARSGARYDSGL